MYVQFTERLSGLGRATCQVRVCVWVIYMSSRIRTVQRRSASLVERSHVTTHTER